MAFPFPALALAENGSAIQLAPVRPNRQFNILASVYVLDNAGNLVPLLPQSVQSISYTIYQVPDVLPPEITNPRTISGNGSFIAANVILPAMLTGTAYSVASPPNAAPGFNANYPIPGAFIPNQNTTYEIQITITLTSGNQFDDWFTVTTYNCP